MELADTVMAIMALINLVSIVLLAPIVMLLLKSYRQQLKAGKDPEFKIEQYPQLLRKGVDLLCGNKLIFQ